MLKISLSIGAWLGLAGLAPAGEHVLVLGDSLSKEYQSEFVGIYPGNPEAWKARNWNEILDAERNSKFDLGSWEVFSDFRLTGHAYNCAKPGGTAREFRNFLRQDDAAHDEIATSPAGELAWALFGGWRNTFNDLIGTADKVVIFFGGNDLALGNSDPMANPIYDGHPKQIDYESIYAGTFGEASNPDLLRDSIRKNIRSIVQYFRVPPGGQSLPRFTGPMVLCGVPHVGCTPKVQHDAGTDPAKTARLTAMIEQLNEELRSLASEFDLGFADVYPITKAILDPAPFLIGGITFKKEADDDCRPRYLFSGDGFHPNTPAQAKIAQTILDAFRNKYPATHGSVPRLSDREIIQDVLHLETNTGYLEWLADHEVPASEQAPTADPDLDGTENVVEYALAGGDPTAPDGDIATPIALESAGGVTTLRLDYLPRHPEDAYSDLIAEQSSDLTTWTAVPAAQLTSNPDGSVTVRGPVTSGALLFFRLAARVAP